MTDDARRTRREGLSELAEDAVGFGGQELRLTRDLLLRPRAVMDAYDAHGSTAGGLYPKPLRYYLTLNSLYLLVIALLGGFERTLVRAFTESDPEMLPKIAAKMGKSEGEMIADMDQWYSLLAIPFYAACLGGAAFLLIRRWSPGPDRQDFRQTFTFLNAFSLLGIPFGLLILILDVHDAWPMAITFGLVALTYARMGAGRWWRTPTGAWLKGALMVVVLGVATFAAALPTLILAMLAGVFLP